jgi:hypothetical protein
MSDISKSAIGEDFPEAFKAGLDECQTPEEVKAYMKAAYVQLGKAEPDAIDPNILHLVEPAGLEPRPFVATVTVEGKKYEFTGATAAEALNAMAAFVAGKAQQTQQTQQREPENKLELIFDPLAKAYRDSAGRFVDQKTAQAIIERHEQEANESYRDAATDADLRAKLLRGEISLIDAMAQIEDKVLSRREQRTWAEATEAALAENGPLSDWPGGQDHLERIANKIDELGLQDAPDKVQALAQAWAAMQEEDAEAEQAKTDEEYAKELAACVSQQDVVRVTAKYFAGRTVHGLSPDELRERGFYGTR